MSSYAKAKLETLRSVQRFVQGGAPQVAHDGLSRSVQFLRSQVRDVPSLLKAQPP